ncbi:MAG: EAL domain-containing protein [Steroidobacteraceae bacterium]
MTTPQLKRTPAAEPPPSQPTAESLGWQLRAALPPLRLHSVSLYDREGEVLWLSEGALGPDEHAFVTEALTALSVDPRAAHCERDFADGRGAALLAIRSPQSDLVGVAMILVDAKALHGGGLPARLLAPAVRAVLQRLAILLRPASSPAAAPAAAVTSSSRTLEILEWSPPDPVSTEPTSTDAVIALDAALAPEAVESILTFELTDEVPSSTQIPAGRTAAAAAAPAPGRPAISRDAGCELYVQELAKLRPGGRTRWLQLLPKQPLSPAPRGAADTGHSGKSRGDGLLERTLIDPLRALAARLEVCPALGDDTTLQFSIAVAPGALEIDDLPEKLAECIRSIRLAPARIGFEIPESVARREHERAERLIHTLERIGCFLVLDDFAFDSSALELLRSKALRLVKVDRALIRAALRDKLAQARIVAISQAARVLGIHCAAKHVEALATQRWLAAAGVDFAEGPLFGGPRSLDSLASELAGA